MSEVLDGMGMGMGWVALKRMFFILRTWSFELEVMDFQKCESTHSSLFDARGVADFSLEQVV